MGELVSERLVSLGQQVLWRACGASIVSAGISVVVPPSFQMVASVQFEMDSCRYLSASVHRGKRNQPPLKMSHRGPDSASAFGLISN